MVEKTAELKELQDKVQAFVKFALMIGEQAVADYKKPNMCEISSRIDYGELIGLRAALSILGLEEEAKKLDDFLNEMRS